MRLVLKGCDETISSWGWDADETYQTHTRGMLGDDGFVDIAHPPSQLQPVDHLRVDEPKRVIPIWHKTSVCCPAGLCLSSRTDFC